MSAPYIVLLMIVISANDACNRGYRQVIPFPSFFYYVVYNLYAQLLQLELLSDEAMCRATLPSFAMTFFMLKTFLLVVTNLTTN